MGLLDKFIEFESEVIQLEEKEGETNEYCG